MNERIYLSPDPEPAAGDGGGEPAPEPVSLSEGTQVAWDGLDEPVSYEDLVEHYQKGRDYTQKTQKLSEQEKQYKQQLEQYQRQAQEWAQYARQLEQMAGRGQQPQAGQQQQGQQQLTQQQADAVQQIIDQVEANGGYVDANSLRQIVQAVQQQSLNPMSNQLQTTLQALGLFYNDYSQLKQQFQSLMEDRAEGSLKDTIRKTAKDLGVPEDYNDVFNELAQDVYRSHLDDDDLRESFRSMIESRWKSLLKAAKARDKQDLEKAKEQSLPGKGGKANPSKPAKPEMDPTEIARMHWRE